MYVFDKKSYLFLSGISTINNIPYLEELLKNLEDPPPLNGLKVEFRDLVKSGHQIKEEQMRKLAEDKKQKRLRKDGIRGQHIRR